MSEPVAPELPSNSARRFVECVVGFGVAVPLGVGLFLGASRIPGFEALLVILPEESRTTLLAISAFFMGIVAVVIQFHAGRSIAQKRVNRRFTATLILLVFGTVTLLVLKTSYVVEIWNREHQRQELFVIGWSRLPKPGCECGPEVSDEKCISGQGFYLGACWSDRSIAQVSNAMYICYLLLTSGFGALIGLLILQEETKKQQKEIKQQKEAKRQQQEQKEKEEQEKQAAAARQPTRNRSTRRASKPTEPPAPGSATAASTADVAEKKPQRGGKIKPGAQAPGTGTAKDEEPQRGDTHDGSEE